MATLRCESCGCQIQPPRKKWCAACARPWKHDRPEDFEAEQGAIDRTLRNEAPGRQPRRSIGARS